MNKGVAVGGVALVAVIAAYLGGFFQGGWGSGDGGADPQPVAEVSLTDANQEAILTLTLRGSGIYAGQETAIPHDQAVEMAVSWAGQGPGRVVHVQITSSALEADVTRLQEELTLRGVTYFVQPAPAP